MVLPHVQQDGTATLATPDALAKPKHKKRYKDHLKEAKARLVSWRFVIKGQHFTPSSFTATAIFPDPLLNALANNRDIKSLQELEECAHKVWPLGKWKLSREAGLGEDGTLFDEALAVVKGLDAEKESVKRQKTAAAAEKERERLRKAEAKCTKDMQEKRRKEGEAWLKEQEEERKRQADVAMGFIEFDSSSPAPSTGAPECSYHSVCQLPFYIVIFTLITVTIIVLCFSTEEADRPIRYPDARSTVVFKAFEREYTTSTDSASRVFAASPSIITDPTVATTEA